MTGLKARDVVVLIGGTTIVGYGRNGEIGIDADTVKEYVFGSDKPAFLASGNKSFTFRIERLYLDSTHATQVLNGSEVTVEVRPEGTGSGKPKYTVDSAVILSWKMPFDQAGIIIENISGEGYSITYGTQT